MSVGWESTRAEVRRRLLELVLAKEDDHPEKIAREIVADFSHRPVTDMAEMWVAEQLAEVQRSVALDYERAAEKLARIKQEEDQRRRSLPRMSRRRAAPVPEQSESDYWAELLGSIQTALDQYAVRKHLEWTQDLLNTAFALGDGRRVAWGEATVEEHRQRVQLLQGNVEGNLQAAARHLVAIRDLEGAGVKTLFDLVACPV